MSLDMEMRAIDDVAFGQDLTPPLPPLAAALHDSTLNSHCSACFSPLPPQPFSPVTPSNLQNTSHIPSATPTLLYCSPHCSSLDLPLHFSSAELHLLSIFRQAPPSAWEDSSDLRLALRLLHVFQKLPQYHDTCLTLAVFINRGKIRSSLGGINGNNFGNKDDLLYANLDGYSQNDGVLERIDGLMTNRELLVFRDIEEGEEPFEDYCNSADSYHEKIREGAKAMAVARSMYIGEDVCSDTEEDEMEFALEEMVLCLVLTNAVEVQDKSGRFLGVAVYGTNFSWINHSCSPNACYRFSVGLEHNEQPLSRIFPAPAENGSCNTKALLSSFSVGIYGHGPRVVVRSIRDVKKGEEVTIAYTDLLLPKDIRQAELWLKYKLRCCCKRCRAVPETYVDCSLQAVSSANLNSPDMIPNHDFSKELKQLIERFDNAISDYLSFSNPELCCEELGNLLSCDSKFDEQLEPRIAESLPKPNLHIFHHVLLNTYITLASACKVCASNLSTFDSAIDEHSPQAFNMYKLSAAYSLLLAGVTHHLFMFESGLLASAANFWIHAGESLLILSRSSFWDSSADSDVLSISSRKCRDCSLADIFEHGNYQHVQLEDMNLQQLNCTASLSSKVWSTLAAGSSFLEFIQDPIDFRWLESTEYARRNGFSRVDAKECEEVRINMILLSSHCLRYGAFLTSICYGYPLSVDPWVLLNISAYLEYLFCCCFRNTASGSFEHTFSKLSPLLQGRLNRGSHQGNLPLGPQIE